MTELQKSKRRIHWRFPPDKTLAEYAAHLGGLLTSRHMSVKPNKRTGEMKVRVEISEADKWAVPLFERIKTIFGLENAVIEERNRNPHRKQRYYRPTNALFVTDPKDVLRLLRPCYDWLDDTPLADKMIAACEEMLRRAS